MRSWEAFTSTFVLGHRGARHNRTENTLHAFEGAREEGAEGTEFDVRLSLDRVPYVFHDRELTRMTDGQDTRLIEQLTSHQIDRIRLPGDLPIPRLEQVLDWAEQHDMLLNIELKSDRALRDPLARVSAEILRGRAEASRWALVSSFHPLLLRQFHQALPDVPTALLLTAGQPNWCRPFVLKTLGASAIHPEASLLLERPQLVERMGAYPVNTWTVNSASEALRLRELGVRGIISDTPATLIDALRTQV